MKNNIKKVCTVFFVLFYNFLFFVLFFAFFVFCFVMRGQTPIHNQYHGEIGKFGLEEIGGHPARGR